MVVTAEVARGQSIQYGDLGRDGCGIHWEIYQDCEGFTRGESYERKLISL